MPINWITEIEELSSAVLTVDIQSAQGLNDDDRLMYPTLMPREDVESVKISNLGEIAFRPASDRRAWNQRGRQIPLVLPKIRDLEIEPIEAFFTIGEREQQALRERFRNNHQLMADQVKGEIPVRVRGLAAANERRIELDVFEAWVNGIVTVRNPETGESYAVSLDFDTDRYETAGTAWSDPGVNAYDELVAWFISAMGASGALSGVALRQAVLNEVLKDAPTLAGGEAMSLARLSDRISQDTGSPFRFYNMDILPDIDRFTDGGIATAPVSRWPDASKIAAVPADQRIGRTKWAPVGRAMDLDAAVPDAKIDVNGQASFPETSNNGRNYTNEVQCNVFPMPNEKRISVMDTLIG
jgi:hypothetical protein